MVFLVGYPIWDWVSVTRCVSAWPESRSLFMRCGRIACWCVRACSRRRLHCVRAVVRPAVRLSTSEPCTHSHRSIYTARRVLFSASMSIRWRTRVCQNVIYWLVLVSSLSASGTVSLFCWLYLSHRVLGRAASNIATSTISLSMWVRSMVAVRWHMRIINMCKIVTCLKKTPNAFQM